ncbi:protein phosphatase 2C domain-containing protein [Streptomyces bambusae]|uniref:protein phosphatase 2C domain-containing protein n=1 Tax=Streptomyces bambusae TaxID=1550616 RepID=UPI001CFE8C68|nr:protein phosphatase 2C domain-containing protein [Streptomyces bambusae]MCB5168778.1 protein phosphatase 2C domain-containing protein [Streptomyces bambusae]
MSQQEGTDDWWQRLYADPAPDPAPPPAPREPAPPDTVDTRFATAARLVSDTPLPPEPDGAPADPPPQPAAAPGADPVVSSAGQGVPGPVGGPADPPVTPPSSAAAPGADPVATSAGYGPPARGGVPADPPAPAPGVASTAPHAGHALPTPGAGPAGSPPGFGPAVPGDIHADLPASPPDAEPAGLDAGFGPPVPGDIPADLPASPPQSAAALGVAPAGYGRPAPGGVPVGTPAPPPHPAAAPAGYRPPPSGGATAGRVPPGEGKVPAGPPRSAAAPGAGSAPAAPTAPPLVPPQPAAPVAGYGPPPVMPEATARHGAEDALRAADRSAAEPGAVAPRSAAAGDAETVGDALSGQTVPAPDGTPAGPPLPPAERDADGPGPRTATLPDGALAVGGTGQGAPPGPAADGPAAVPRPPAPRAAPDDDPAAYPRAAPEARPLIPPQQGPVADGTGFAWGRLNLPPAEAAGRGERFDVRHLGERPPTYEGEPGALPYADAADLDALVPDTVLEGARHGTYTLRAVSVRGDSARYRGEARRDFLLTARFGTGDDALVLIAAAGGDRAAEGAREADAELCRWIAGAIGRSQQRLGADIRAGRRDDLRSGLQRLTDRGYGRLRADGAPQPAGLRCLLLPIDPECRTRIAFGTGQGGLFRLRDGTWQDLENPASAEDAFRFRASVARAGDTLLLCTGGLAAPMREEPVFPAELATRWGPDSDVPPGLAAFLADTTVRLKGYADDRTAVAVWET